MIFLGGRVTVRSSLAARLDMAISPWAVHRLNRAVAAYTPDARRLRSPSPVLGGYRFKYLELLWWSQQKRPGCPAPAPGLLGVDQRRIAPGRLATAGHQARADHIDHAVGVLIAVRDLTHRGNRPCSSTIQICRPVFHRQLFTLVGLLVFFPFVTLEGFEFVPEPRDSVRSGQGRALFSRFQPGSDGAARHRIARSSALVALRATVTGPLPPGLRPGRRAFTARPQRGVVAFECTASG